MDLLGLFRLDKNRQEYQDYFKQKQSNEQQYRMPIKVGDPTSFDTYYGQEKLKLRLKLRLNAMRRGESLKALFQASSGQGKTALTRVLAMEMLERKLIDYYYEVIASQFDNKKELDRFIKSLLPNSLVFIDEIHNLTGGVRDALYPAIQDNMYGFYNSNTLTPLPNGISWVGATTEKIHPALQRRLVPMSLEPMGTRELTMVAMSQPVSPTLEAAEQMATRSWTPWEVKDEIYVVARDVAINRGQKELVEKEDVLQAFDILEIDEHSLRPKERDILKVLFMSPKTIKGEIRFTLARTPLVALAGVDGPTYDSSIEPKLMRLGFLRVSSGVGRELTERAIEEYFHKEK